jgi:YggT family protein
MDQALGAYAAFVFVVRQVLFWLALAVALVALLDWLVRTRRVQPFGALARFCRRFVDPLMAPIERRVVRRGGLPQHAPWWSLGVVIVGGLLLVTLLEFFGGAIASILVGMRSPGGALRLVVAWTFMILRLALIVRVVSSWFQLSPYSPWIRWSFTLTEWMLAPLRRIVPAFGPVDVTPIVAFLLLALLQRVVGGVL